MIRAPADPIVSAVVPLAKYVARRGYRDGIAGLAYAFDRAYYKFLVQAKRWDEARAGLRRARYDVRRDRIIAGFEGWPERCADYSRGYPGQRRRQFTKGRQAGQTPRVRSPI